jgi:hypothetical protein
LTWPFDLRRMCGSTSVRRGPKDGRLRPKLIGRVAQGGQIEERRIAKKPDRFIARWAFCVSGSPAKLEWNSHAGSNDLFLFTPLAGDP